MSAPAPVPLAGVVLCGGRSRRMGADKATLRVGQMTMLERAVDRLLPLCEPVIIASGERRLEVAGHPVVADAVPGAGPLGGLLAGLRASPRPALAAVAVDMPWIDVRLLHLLGHRCQGHDAAVALSEHGLEPLHAVYAAGALGACEAAAAGGDLSLLGLLARLDLVVVRVDEWLAAGIKPGFAANVNTPADLEQLSRTLG